MILNSLALLDFFVSGLRLVLSSILVFSGLRVWRGWRPVLSAEARSRCEDRIYLLFLIALVLVALEVAAWPLFYLLLDSYVPQWAGVMCIYGVTQVGRDSVSSSRFLPGLVMAIEYLRPTVLFLSGSWMLFYGLNRHTVSAPLTGRMLAAMIAMGSIALLDASAEITYLAIPKVEKHLAAGCCSAANRIADRSFGAADATVRSQRAIQSTGAVFGLTILLAGVGAFVPSARKSRLFLAVLAALGVVALGVGVWLLRDAAAPRLLGLPRHQCIYCLFAQVPESVLTALLLVLGGFSLGWAFVAGFARHAETQGLVACWQGTLLRCGFWCYLGFAIMVSWEMWLAR